MPVWSNQDLPLDLPLSLDPGTELGLDQQRRELLLGSPQYLHSICSPDLTRLS